MMWPWDWLKCRRDGRKRAKEQKIQSQDRVVQRAKSQIQMASEQNVVATEQLRAALDHRAEQATVLKNSLNTLILRLSEDRFT